MKSPGMFVWAMWLHVGPWWISPGVRISIHITVHHTYTYNAYSFSYASAPATLSALRVECVDCLMKIALRMYVYVCVYIYAEFSAAPAKCDKRICMREKRRKRRQRPPHKHSHSLPQFLSQLDVCICFYGYGTYSKWIALYFVRRPISGTLCAWQNHEGTKRSNWRGEKWNECTRNTRAPTATG